MAIDDENPKWNRLITIELNIPAHYAMLVAAAIKSGVSDPQENLEIPGIKDIISAKGKNVLVGLADDIIIQAKEAVEK